MTFNSNGSSPSFDAKNSIEWITLQQHFSSGITFNEILSISSIICEILNMKPITRSEKRSFCSLLSWYHKNWNEISQVLPFIHVVDDNFNEVSGATQVQKLKRRSRYQ